MGSARAFGWTFALLMLPGAWAGGESVDDVERALTEKMRKVTSLTADVRLQAQTVVPFKTSMVMRGKVEQAWRDGKLLFLKHGKVERVAIVGGKEQKDTQDIFSIQDGKYSWRQEQVGMTYYAVKSWPGEAPIIGGGFFEAIRRNYSLTLGAEDRVDGEPCWVIVANTKAAIDPDNPYQLVRTVYYFRKTDGMMVRNDTFQADGTLVLSMQYSNLSVNPVLDPQRFQYTPPAGMEVLDETVEADAQDIQTLPTPSSSPAPK